MRLVGLPYRDKGVIEKWKAKRGIGDCGIGSGTPLMEIAFALKSIATVPVMMASRSHLRCSKALSGPWLRARLMYSNLLKNPEIRRRPWLRRTQRDRGSM